MGLGSKGPERPARRILRPLELWRAHHPRLLLLRLLASSAASDPPLYWAAATGAVANAAIYVFVWLALDRLPLLMPLHYDGAGVVDLIGPPRDLFKLPAIATLLLLADAAIALRVHRRERLAAYLVVWTGIVVQALFAVGVWFLITRAAGE